MPYQIHTIHHRRDPQLESFKKHFSPMQVGSATSKVDLGILRDDAQGQISHKNSSYCELTAFDQIARSESADYIGIMHYRRMFSRSRALFLGWRRFKFQIRSLKYDLLGRKKELIFTPVISMNDNIQIENEAEKLKSYLLSQEGKYDIFYPIPVKFRNRTVKEEYAAAHFVEHYDLFISKLLEHFPNMSRAVDAKKNTKELICGNMFIMKRQIFDLYWKMLSTVLAECEKQIDIETLDPYQRRVFGFVAERFMAIFIDFAEIDMNWKCKSLPTIFCNTESV